MDHFATEINDQIDRLRTALEEARSEQNELRESALLGEMESLVGIADRNGLDTGQLHNVLAVETGALPVIPEKDA